MKQAIIVANGQMEATTDLAGDFKASALVIAADGGVHHCIRLGIEPNVIIGDLDSTSQDELISYRQSGVDIIQYPTRKDETDLELALTYAKDHGVTKVIILGAFGSRWDMTMANILMTCLPIYSEMKIRLLDGTQELSLLRSGERSSIQGYPGDILSLIPLTGDASGVITDGLEYPLKDETLHFGTSRGVSNVFVTEKVNLFVKQGLLLISVNRVRKLSGIP
jgi:thiamine pyrophosphokinase